MNILKIFPILILSLVALLGSIWHSLYDTLAMFNTVSKTLNGLQTIQYIYRREFSYPSEGYLI
jgi:hypothetical protein